MILLLAACATPPAAPPELRFVRGGLLVRSEDPSAGEPLGPWHFTARDWKAGESVTLAGATDTAPARAECVSVGEVPLGDVSRVTAAGGAAPDTDLAFSPDGKWLAIGSYLGEVLVVDVATGQVAARRKLAEAMVRRVAFSADGSTIYAGEQSPDGNVVALERATLTPKWSVRLADRLETSAPEPTDLYGIYSFPGVYGLEVLPDGDLLVAGAHSWPGADGNRRNRSQVLRIAPDGSIRAVWPAEPADASFTHPRVDAEGGRIVVPVTHTSTTPAPADLPVGGVQMLDLATFTPSGSFTVPPLAPWFKSTYLWQAHDLSVAQDALLVGLGDGRVVLAHLDGTPRATVSGGSPILAGEVPIAASVGHGLLHGDSALFLTSGTNIPWGAAAPDLRPPSAHPAENTVFAVNLDGTPRWSFHGDWEVEGLTLGDDDRTLIVGAGDRRSDERRDLYGALLFDLGGETRSGDARLLTTCTTRGPVFYLHAMSAQGVLALAETPYKTANGGVEGAYQVSLFR